MSYLLFQPVLQPQNKCTIFLQCQMSGYVNDWKLIILQWNIKVDIVTFSSFCSTSELLKSGNHKSGPGLFLRCVQWHLSLDSAATPQVLVHFHLFNQPSITAGCSQQQNPYSENYINRMFWRDWHNSIFISHNINV